MLDREHPELAKKIKTCPVCSQDKMRCNGWSSNSGEDFRCSNCGFQLSFYLWSLQEALKKLEKVK